MGLYAGFDLHSSNTYVRIIDEDGKRIWKKKLRNNPRLISESLRQGRLTALRSFGNYVSYCKKVPAARFSNEKKKGTGNRKNGNKYLA